jgi:hypothetical protein
MTITRDVIYDLLPAYFAGEASPDTRALVDEFFETDPEFGRMAQRFRTLLDERVRETVDTESASARERKHFERIRTLMKRRNQAFAGGVAYGLAALIALVLANPLNPPMPQTLVAAALLFVAIQLMSWGFWYWAVRQLSSITRSSATP